MLGLIACLYWLLTMRLHVQASLRIENQRAKAYLLVSLGPVHLVRRILNIGHEEIRKLISHNDRGTKRWENTAMRIMLSPAHAEYIFMHAAVGLQDAAYTAVTTGMLRAAVSSALARLAPMAAREIQIVPVFSRACFTLRLQGIFSCPVGDIIFSVFKAAVGKKQSEGFLWKSIPLRA